MGEAMRIVHYAVNSAFWNFFPTPKLPGRRGITAGRYQTKLLPIAHCGARLPANLMLKRFR